MQFASFPFLMFLPLTFAVVYNLPVRMRRPFMLLACYVFYASWIPPYALVLLGLTVLDYSAAILISRIRKPGWARAIWIGSLAANLLLLLAFKYAGYLDFIFGKSSMMNYFMPIGISFHTFQSMAYTTLVYKDRPAERNFITYALFICWFPQLVAGPIERADDLLPQLREIRNPRADEIREGIALIAWGFFKKLVIADNFAGVVWETYQILDIASPWVVLLSVYLFALQIYFDFSGYTDIARGSSLLFGVRLSQNFDRPLLARTIPEFWSRWNITLTNWFFEHIFFPLARRFPGTWAMRASLLFVFVLSGVWHGSGLKFIIWGLLNGFFYLLYQAAGARLNFKGRLTNAALIAVNFNIISFCWIFFRAESMTEAYRVFERIGEIVHTPLPESLGNLQYMMLKAIIGGAILLTAQRFQAQVPSNIYWRSAGYFALLICLLSIGRFTGLDFVYFQF